MPDNLAPNTSSLQHLAALQHKLFRLSTSSVRSRHLAVLLATAAILFSFSKLCSRDALFWLMVPVALLAWMDAYQSHLRQVFTTRYDAFLKKLVAANGQGRIKEEDVPSLAVPVGLDQVFLTLKAMLSVAILPFYGGLLLMLLVLGNGWDQESSKQAGKAAHSGCGGSCGSSGGAGCGSGGGCGSGAGGCGGSCGGGGASSKSKTMQPGASAVPLVPSRPGFVPMTPGQANRPPTAVPNGTTLAPAPRPVIQLQSPPAGVPPVIQQGAEPSVKTTPPGRTALPGEARPAPAPVPAPTTPPAQNPAPAAVQPAASAPSPAPLPSVPATVPAGKE